MLRSADTVAKYKIPRIVFDGMSCFKQFCTHRYEQVRETESKAYGMVINSFEELEQEYVKEFKKLKEGKVWCIGPLSLSSNNYSSTSIDAQRLSTWLDLKEPGSVVYACFGGSSRVIPSPTNRGLEVSDRSLKWVIRSSERAQEVEKWLLESRFEDRVKDRGLIIIDWSPQVLILSHPLVGGS